MVPTASPNPFDRARVIVPALAISAIGALFYNLLPLYLGAAQDDRGLGNQEIGFLTAAFFLGYNLVTIWAFFWIRRWNWRKATAVWIPVALLGLMAGAFSGSYGVLLLTTAVSGGGFAAVYGIGTTVLADTSNPARWYGVKIAAEAFPGAILLFVLPATLAGSHGFAGVVAGMAAMVVLLSLAAFTLPAAGRHDQNMLTEEEVAQQLEGLDRRAVWAGLIATFTFFSAASGMWAFIERMGATRDFSAASIGNLLAASLVAATIGSLITAWLGKRFGNTHPFVFTGCLFLLALYLLAGEPAFEIYALGTAVLTFAIGMGLPFAVAEVARLDADGRFVILSVPAIGFGAMLGPAAAGTLADAGSFAVVLVVAAATIVCSVIAMLVARAVHGR